MNDDGGRGGQRVDARLAAALVPGALMVWLSFNAAGFFAKTIAFAVLAVLILLVLWVVLAPRPFEGLTLPLGVVVSPFALLAAWALISSGWSGAPARALFEFDRLLLYTVVLLLSGLVVRGRRDIRWMVRGVALAAVAVCVAAFLHHVSLDAWSMPRDAVERLSHPLTYWNALGLLAAVAALLCLSLSCDEREHPVVRVLGAAALPLMPATLLFTLSRGALAAAAVGLVVLVVAARFRGLVTGLLAAVPAAVTAVATYRSDLLAAGAINDKDISAAASEITLLVAVCMAAAAVIRAVLLLADRALARLRPVTLPRAARAGAAALLAVVALVAFVALDGPDRVSSQYERFVRSDAVATAQARDRLSARGSNYRPELWSVAVDNFEREPLKGRGAGTFEVFWAEERPIRHRVSEAHSLYFETLAELGLVGGLLLLVILAVVFVALLVRVAGPDRTLHAGVLAAAVTWAVHAGLDVDWEMPAVTLWLIAIAGAVLGTWRRRPGAGVPPRQLRLAVAVGLLALAVIPVSVGRSQIAIDRALESFEAGDCPRTIDASVDALEALSVRPEALQLLGYCDARLGQHELAQRAMTRAVSVDPDNWATHYGLAVVQAAAGVDPRREARLAARLNPRSPFTRDMRALLRTSTKREWTRRAARTRLVIR